METEIRTVEELMKVLQEYPSDALLRICANGDYGEFDGMPRDGLQLGERQSDGHITLYVELV